MDIKKVIASISGIELFFMIAGIIVPIIFIGYIFFFKIKSKGVVDDCRLIKHDSWAGDLISTKMESWQKPI